MMLVSRQNFQGENQLTKIMKASSIVVLVFLSSLVLGQESAQESKFEVGVRANVLLGDGIPANDILGLGVIGRYSLNNGWFIGAGVDKYEYDYERPASYVNLRQDPDEDVIDALADSTVIFGSLGRLYNRTDRGFDWFWSLGVGFASTDVDDVSGPTDTGGTFDLTFDVGNEIHLMGTFGTSYNISENWSTSFSARLEHHFMDVLVTDRVSGATKKIDSQSPIGASQLSGPQSVG